MALYIDGMIACNSREDALRIDASFKNLPFVHNLGDPPPYVDEQRIWWISITPKGIGYGVPYDSPDDRASYAPVRPGILASLYEHLRACTGYKLALFGLEVGERFHDMDEDQRCLLGGVPMPRDLTTNEGLVVSEETFLSVENKEHFERFSMGYYWIARTDGWREFDR